jgi:hypothetical protein
MLCAWTEKDDISTNKRHRRAWEYLEFIIIELKHYVLIVAGQNKPVAPVCEFKAITLLTVLYS